MQKKWIAATLLMLMLSLLCGAAMADTSVKINETNFPDANFRAYVKSNFDKDRNGSLSETERNAVYRIYIEGEGIADLTGIKYFANMTELICPKNSLRTLNVSGNKSLTMLSCADNQLSSLTVSGCADLEMLVCDGNQLTSLNVKNNKKLKELLCGDNQLTSLDVSANRELEYLSVSMNKLSALNVRSNPRLRILYCYGCGLKALDITQNPLLRELTCEWNSIPSLDLRKCPKLNALVQKITPTVPSMSEHYLYQTSTMILYIDQSTRLVTVPQVDLVSIGLRPEKATLTRTSKSPKPTLQLKAVFTPSNATYQGVTWKSSNPKVATVSSKGRVTALKAGKVTITCTSQDGSEKKAACKITIRDKKISKITLNKKTATLTAGKTLKLKAKVIPADALNQELKWTSSNKKIATVDKNGKVTAKKAGKVKITCTATDGSGKKATCVITVK